MSKFLFLPQKAAVWLNIYIVGLLFFFIFRLMMLLLHLPLIKNSSVFDIIHSFLLGFGFDSMVLSIIILPLFLISLLPFIDFAKRVWRRTLNVSLGFIFLILFFVCTADLGYIDHFGSRMNYWAIDYADHPWLFIYSLYVSGDFWLMISVWMLIGIAFFITLGFAIERAASPVRQDNRRAAVIIYTLALILLIVGLCGGIGTYSLSWGDAFFGKNHFINQLSFNSIYSVAFHTREDYINRHSPPDSQSQRYVFYNNREAYQTTKRLLGIHNTDSTDNFSLEYQTKGNSTLGYKPNVIVVVMESWTAERVGVLGSKLNVSPEFDSLSRYGILFTDFYANGIRTNRGVPAVLCSFPSIPGRSIMKRKLKYYPFRSLAEILDDFGYLSIFTYGGDINFDNIGGFLKKVGYNKFFDRENFDRKDYLGDWGVGDHVMFARMVDEIIKFPRPFNLSILTISNHEPFLVPDKRFELYADTVPQSNQLNAFYYSDWAIGRFIDSMKQYPVFDSTIFIFTADHCPHQSAEFPLDPRNFRVPLLIYAPGIIGDTSVIFDKTGSQVDIIPTLIGILGLQTKMYCWGRDLLSLPINDSGFAIVNAERKLGMFKDSLLYFHWIGATKELYDLRDRSYLENNIIDSLPHVAEEMEKQLDSYIQTANSAAKAAAENN